MITAVPSTYEAAQRTREILARYTKTPVDVGLTRLLFFDRRPVKRVIAALENQGCTMQFWENRDDEEYPPVQLLAVVHNDPSGAAFHRLKSGAYLQGTGYAVTNHTLSQVRYVDSQGFTWALTTPNFAEMRIEGNRLFTLKPTIYVGIFHPTLHSTPLPDENAP